MSWWRLLRNWIEVPRIYHRKLEMFYLWVLVVLNYTLILKELSAKIISVREKSKGTFQFLVAVYGI